MRPKFKLSIHRTGTSPIKTSRKVPPPNAVMKAMIKTPKISSFFFIAAKVPAMLKAAVPIISIIVIDPICDFLSAYIYFAEISIKPKTKFTIFN